MCNVRPEDRISAVKLRNKMKLNEITECLHNKRLLWLGHLGHQTYICY